MDKVIVELEHALGTRRLEMDGVTVADVLAHHRLPETLFQAYVVGRRGDAVPVPAWTPLSAVPPDSQRVVVRAIRNTLFSTILPGWDAQDGDADVDGLQVGTGFTAVRQEEASPARRQDVVLNADQARDQVAAQVAAFVDEYDVSAAGCVFGLSGGGDSNALAYGLRRALPADRLLAFTLTFRDVMPKAAADRAALLCQELGIEHRVFSPDDLADLLGMTTSLDALYDDFSRVFGEEALHFFGTFLILRTARRLGAERGLRDLAFGYNREDLLAELLFMLMNGHPPLSYPVRPLGDQRIVMPVWQAPKLLLDACHPTFSLENYRERDAVTTRQRSLAFFLAHSLDSAYPAFGLSLLTGTRRVLQDSFGELVHHEATDLFITGQATPERLAAVGDLLDRHFPAAGTS